MQAGGLEIIDALEAMDLVQRLHGLQFDQNRVVYQQVYEILADYRSLVSDRGAVLRWATADPASREFKREGILVDLFEAIRPQAC